MYNKKCAVCGRNFEAKKNCAKYCCSACKKIGVSAVQKRYRARKEAEQAAKPKTLNEKLAEIRAYNEANGTHLTYGKYMAMKYIQQQQKNK